MSDYTVGQRLGDYEILGVLGAGGMGKVYKVRNVISDRVEAMKILLPNLASQKDLADRFLREIKLLGTLSHPNIASLRTALTLDNQLVMIMEYVDGVTLSSRVQQGAIPAGEVVKYVDQVLAALSYAHKLGIVHRDIKPANMMLTPDGTVKLMDFGIARSGSDHSLTATGITLGSLNYMPPEQVKGETIDARADIYSLGVSMYEMVTGILPFEAGSNFSLMTAHVEQTPKEPVIHKPGLPEALNQIILMAMAKDPGNRFQTADAFRAALSTVNIPTSASAGTTMPTAWASPHAGGTGNDETLAVTTPAPELVRSAARANATPAPVAASVPASAAAAASVPPATARGTATAAPVATASGTVPPPHVAAAASKRGLWMGLGALVVVGVLFAAGFYLPRRAKIHAGENQAVFSSKDSSAPASSTSGSSGANGGGAVDKNATTTGAAVGAAAAGAGNSTMTPTAPAAPPVPGSMEGNTPVMPPPEAGAAAAAAAKRAARKAAEVGSAATNAEMIQAARDTAKAAIDAAAAATQQALAQQQNQAALDEAEKLEEQLSGRAAAITSSLDNLKKAQSGQGYGLRGDVVAAEQRMQTYMSKANVALQQQNGPAAKKYFEQAETEINFLEKFLGR